MRAGIKKTKGLRAPELGESIMSHINLYDATFVAVCERAVAASMDGGRAPHAAVCATVSARIGRDVDPGAVRGALLQSGAFGEPRRGAQGGWLPPGAAPTASASSKAARLAKLVAKARELGVTLAPVASAPEKPSAE